MKTFPLSLSLLKRTLTAALVASSVLASTTASAASITWDGGGANSNWATGLNWVGDTAPVASVTNDLIFAGSTRLAPVVNSGSNYNVSTLTFASGAGQFVVGGASSTSKITLGSVTNSSSVLQTLGDSNFRPILDFTSSGTIDTGAAGLLFKSNIQGSGNLSKTGSGQLEINNTSLSNTYSGTLTVSAGSLLLSAGMGSANLMVDSGAILNTGTSGATINNLSVSGTVQPGTAADFGGLNVLGNLTLNSTASTLMAARTDIDGSSINDSITISGSTAFGGNLVINMENAATVFNENIDDAQFWSLFTPEASVAGDFNSITMTGFYGNVSFTKLAGGDSWQSTYLGDGKQFEFFVSGPRAGILYAVPEPSTIVFAGIGVAMFGWNTWTRRRAKARRHLIEAAIA